MNRRQLLAGSAGSLLPAVCGCLTDNGGSQRNTADEASPATDTDSEEAEPDASATSTAIENETPPTKRAETKLVLANRAETDNGGALSVAQDDDTLLETTFAVAAGTRQPLAAPVTDPRQYSLIVPLESGAETETSLAIDDDLTRGRRSVLSLLRRRYACYARSTRRRCRLRLFEAWWYPTVSTALSSMRHRECGWISRPAGTDSRPTTGFRAHGCPQLGRGAPTHRLVQRHRRSRPRRW